MLRRLTTPGQAGPSQTEAVRAAVFGPQPKQSRLWWKASREDAAHDAMARILTSDTTDLSPHELPATRSGKPEKDAREDVLGDGSIKKQLLYACLLYTSPSPRDLSTSRMPSSA